jgi:hypothetical protein
MDLPQEQPNFISSSAIPANGRTLWALFKGGNRDAFSKIYQNHIQTLFSYGIKICADNQVVVVHNLLECHLIALN